MVTGWLADNGCAAKTRNCLNIAKAVEGIVDECQLLDRPGRWLNPRSRPSFFLSLGLKSERPATSSERNGLVAEFSSQETWPLAVINADKLLASTQEETS